MKKKLLFIMIALGNGGGQRSLLNLLDLLDYNMYDVDLILFKEKGMFLKQLPENVRIQSECDILHTLYEDSIKKVVGLHHPYLNTIHIVGTADSKIRCKSDFQKGQYRWEHYYNKEIPIYNKKYDVAISFMEGETTYYLVDKVIADKKFVWIHTDYSKIDADTNMDLRYFKQVDKVVSISSLCVDVLKRTFPSIAEKFIELPNLTSSKTVRLLSQEFFPEEYKDVNYKFVSIGRLVPLKGFDMAIQAASIIKKKGFHFKWFVLGEGEIKSKLEDLRTKFDVEDCFEFLGSRENPYAYMANADIVVQTSRYEGKSMVLDEAKILNKPIVVTNYDTVQDQIKPGEGLIVNMTPEGIAQGILEMLDDNKRQTYSEYLSEREYGNQEDINLYYKVIDS